MTSSDEILARFGSLNIWRRRDERAPHKPLLVLYALGQWQQGRPQVSFSDVDREVGRLLRDFGPPRKTTAAYPFSRLENDGIWRIDLPPDVRRRAPARTEPLLSELRRLDPSAGFTPDVLEALDRQPALAGRLAHELLDGHFPETTHADILAAVGLEADTYTTTRRRRDPKFRERVLGAYDHRCCVCGFDARLGAVSVALDAAHIQWHQARGPDVESNGLALCSLHHKTFDVGAFTLDPDHRVLVAAGLVGSDRVREAVHAYGGKPITAPREEHFRPDEKALGWHRTQVFKGRA